MASCQKCGTPNGPAVQFCRQCGESLNSAASAQSREAAPAPPPTPRATPILDKPPAVAVFESASAAGGFGTPVRLGIGALLLISVIAAGTWWFVRPSVVAILPAAVVAAPVAVAASAVPTPVGEPASAPAIASAMEVAVPASSVSAASAAEGPAIVKSTIARDKAESTKAKALREQLAAQQAEADAARRRAEEETARTAAAPPPAAVPAPEPLPPPAPKPRTAQELCSSGNAISQGFCLARECIGAEHAEEAACKRLRAADDQRRH